MSKLENRLQVLILAVVGLAAGAASFTHVHDWTMSNSPAGTPGWFGWANACISELVPIGALLTIRKNRRIGKKIGYPVFMLLAAACLSLSAQLAVAKPSASGWLLSAVPALAFMGLMKMVLAGLPTKAADPVPTPAVPIATVVPMPTPAVPMPRRAGWVTVPADSARLTIIAAQKPVPMPIAEPVADVVPIPSADSASAKRQPRKQRKPVVPAHPERADSASKTDAEILAAFEAMFADGKKLADIADALGISVRKLFNIRKAAEVVQTV